MLKLVCLHCNVQFYDYEGFSRHVAKYVKWKPFKCYYCLERFNTIMGILLHMENRHESESLQARFNHQPIGKRCFYDLIAHGVVEGARGFPVDTRPSLTDSAPLLNLKCDKEGCELSFERVDDLITHLFEERLPFSRQYKCTRCTRIYNNPDRVQKHLEKKHRVRKDKADRFLISCAEVHRSIQQKVMDILEAFQQHLIEENDSRDEPL